MYTNDRNAYREVYHQAWLKHLQGKPLDQLEIELVEILKNHPEYHELVAHKVKLEDYELEENPFIHMSLHQAVRDQIKTDRPAGIRKAYQDIILTMRNQHAVEHLFIQCLAQLLWEAQKTGMPPDEVTYLEKINALK